MKVSQWVSQLLPGTPTWLRLALGAGAILTLVSVFGALRAKPAGCALKAYNEGTYLGPLGSTATPGGEPEPVGACQDVLRARAERLSQFDDLRAQSDTRQHQLEKLLIQPDSNHFLGARGELQREREFGKDVDSRSKALAVESQSTPAVPLMLVAALFAAVLTIWIAKDYQRLRRLLADGTPSYTQAGWWWIAAFLLGTVPGLVGQFMLRFETDKTWFGWDSYCISVGSFLCVKLALAGNQLMAACPVAILAEASRADLLALARGPGARAYVRFTTFWTFWGLLVALCFAGIWLWLAFNTTRTPSERVSYGASVLGTASVILLLLHRFHSNMKSLRAQRLPNDPTSAFFDDVPWRLPPTLLGLGTTAWFLLDKLGVLNSLLGR